MQLYQNVHRLMQLPARNGVPAGCLMKPALVVDGPVDPVTSVLAARFSVGTYNPEALLEAVGDKGASCPKLLIDMPDIASSLLKFRATHVMPLCMRPGIEAALKAKGGDALVNSALEESLVEACSEKISGMLSGELGYDFLYAQLVGTVDALWTKAKNDSLLRQLADFRNQMAVERASAPPKQKVSWGAVPAPHAPLRQGAAAI